MVLGLLFATAAASVASVPLRPVGGGYGAYNKCNISPATTAAVRDALNGREGGKPFLHHFRLQTMQYDGGMMGVKASVILDRRSERAIINLRGIPVGGSLTGMAWFKKDGESVEIESDLYHALGRRGVSIESAGAYKDYSYIWVRVKMPLGMGSVRLILPKTTTKKTIYAR
jgi:hypothetical protein